jgi:hypothetical protein
LNLRDVARIDHHLDFSQYRSGFQLDSDQPLVSTVLAEYVFEEMYSTSGIMKLVLDPKINDDQFMTKISHPWNAM